MNPAEQQTGKSDHAEAADSQREASLQAAGARPVSALIRVRRRTVSIALSLYKHRADQEAGSMAFWLFLGLVPLAAVFGWALTRFAQEEVRNLIMHSLLVLTPQPAIGLIDTQMSRLTSSGQALAPISLVGFLWLASRSMHSALTAIQTARFGRSLPWWRNRLISLLFVVVFLVTLPVAAAILALAAPATSYALHHGWLPPGWTTLLRYVAVPLSVVVTAVATALFYRLAYPLRRPKQIRPAKIWPGAWLASILWVSITWFLSHHADLVTKFPLFYGSLAAVALIMIWLWAGSFVLLVGFELNLQQEGSRETMVPHPPPWLTKVREHAANSVPPLVRTAAPSLLPTNKQPPKDTSVPPDPDSNDVKDNHPSPE